MKRTVLAMALALSGAFAFSQQQPVVAVAPFDANSGVSTADADTITDVFFVRLGNTRRVSLVNRGMVERIIREHNFQAGDWSNERKTAALGEALNADWIVQGNIRRLGNNILVIVQFYDIKTFRFEGGTDVRLANIDEAYDKMDPLVDSLLRMVGSSTGVRPSAGTPASGGISIEVSTDKGGDLYFQGQKIATLWDNDTHTIPIETPGTYSLKLVLVNKTEKITSVTITSRGVTKVDFSTIAAIAIGSPGPAGGIVFYDKGSYSDGWRYLEAAPANYEFTSDWNSAEGKCRSLNIGGFSGWRLPTKDELDLMYKNLKQKGLGGFNNNWYWSSSQINSNYAWYQRFSDGGQFDIYGKGSTFSVRAVRAF
jgi:TolB-like protein